MMKNRLKLVIILSLLVYSNTNSQEKTSEKQAHDVSTPEVANLMKYVDFPNLDYIGKTDISVPLYNISFGKLTIPISISYNTKGNKVADIATSVGLGWNLNSGGNLTVKVNDMNDFTETYSYYTTATFEPEQSLAWHRQTKGYLTTLEPSALSSSNTAGAQLCINHRIWENDDTMIDSAPDFYYINAPGLTEKFYLTRINNTQLKAIFFNSPYTKLKNNLNLNIRPTCSGYESSHFGTGGKATVFYEPDKFEIIGENGYIYTFNIPEASIITEYPQDLLSHNSKQVNNWYLTKIKDPFCGKEINFEYEGYLNTYEHLSLTTSNSLSFGNYPMAYNIELGTMVYNYDTYPAVYNRLTTSRLAPFRLKKIVTDKEIINLNYSFNRIDYAGSALSTIQINDKGNRSIKQINFSYSYFDSTGCTSGDYECKRLRLDKIDDSTVGSYKFSYDNHSFPARNSSKIDFLGYYNDNDSNITFSKDNFHATEPDYYPGTKMYFYPDLTKDQLFPFQLTNKQAYHITGGVDRTPKIISKLGLLRAIVYPTSGVLDLNYENDDFMYEGIKYILGSTRINNMKFYDYEKKISKEINYKYINEDQTSSGQINFITTPSNNVRTHISSGIGFNTGAVIGYSRIIEETVGKGYIERRYTNFNDYPDKLMTSDHNFTDQGSKNFLKFLKFPSSYIQSFDNRRGKPLTVNYYKEGLASPIKKETFSYNYLVKDSLKVQKAFSNYGNNNYYIDNYTASNYILRYYNNVKNNLKEEYFPGNTVKEENLFNYDDARLIYKKTISGGETVEEFYRNAKDKSIQKLIDANILDENIEVEMRKSGKLIAKTETKYENIANLLPSSLLSYDLQNNPSLEVTYNQYDSKGNLLQYTTKNNIPVSLIWGYNNNLLIAKIEGAIYNTIKDNSRITAIINASNNDATNSNSETALKIEFDNLTQDNVFKDYQITTYSYDPLIGVTSITPPSGIRENYRYDAANRLEKIVDKENKTSKEYKYKYAPTKYYNVEKRQTFKRNCGSGAIGSSYNYIVSPNQYSSLLSQADADLKAQNEINTNGQNTANSNGTCTSVYCQLSFNTSAGFNGGGNATPSSNDYYKVYIGYSTGPNSTTLPWSTGVKVATINGICKPKADHSSYNGQVYYTIKANGDIYIKPHQGTIPPNNTSYNYELSFPVN